MRKIKFRGKSVKTGEWLYGYLQKYQETHASRLCVCAASVKTWADALLYEVIPETVGQYTGMTDKNGKEIYEGDIVREQPNKAIHYILFSCFTGAFVMFSISAKCITGSFHSMDSSASALCLEVIGNIHDHPELMEGGNK